MWPKNFELSFCKSILFTAIIKALPSSATRSQIVRSCFSNGQSASKSKITTSANLMARTASETEIFSGRSLIFAFLRRPAVSNRRTFRSPQLKSTEIESLVNPASGPVIILSSPSSKLTMVDLPAFGLPTMATFKARSPSSSPSNSAWFSFQFSKPSANTL